MLIDWYANTLVHKDTSMLVVSILAQKGGVGKSMLARSLAVQGLLDGRKTALIDADPQGTVTAWSKRRQLNVPAVVALGASTLAIVLAELQRKGLISGKAVSRKRLDCTTIHHTSTTVVVMDQHAVYSANIGRCLGASGATQTRLESARRAAVWPARAARRDAESRRHSTAHQPSRRFECR
jgi:CobQ/CobB/MinD/ParA nucleotide binding domain